MTAKDILYVWYKGEKSIVLSPKLSLKDFLVDNVETHGVEVEEGSKTYSSLIVQLIFQRSGSFRFVFLFSSILVFISWLGFFLDSELTTEKILLFLIPEVASIAMFFCIRTVFLPNLPYLCAIEIYIFFCAVMIFFTSIQFVTKHILNMFKDGPDEKHYRLFDCLSKLSFPVVFVIFQIWFWSFGY